jgi:hypothetical protein
MPSEREGQPHIVKVQQLFVRGLSWKSSKPKLGRSIRPPEVQQSGKTQSFENQKNFSMRPCFAMLLGLIRNVRHFVSETNVLHFAFLPRLRLKKLHCDWNYETEQTIVTFSGSALLAIEISKIATKAIEVRVRSANRVTVQGNNINTIWLNEGGEKEREPREAGHISLRSSHWG